MLCVPLGPALRNDAALAIQIRHDMTVRPASRALVVSHIQFARDACGVHTVDDTGAVRVSCVALTSEAREVDGPAAPPVRPEVAVHSAFYSLSRGQLADAEAFVLSQKAHIVRECCRNYHVR